MSASRSTEAIGSAQRRHAPGAAPARCRALPRAPSRASSCERGIDRLPHDGDGRVHTRKPAPKRRRALRHEHAQAVRRAEACPPRGADPRGFAPGVAQIERGDDAARAGYAGSGGSSAAVIPECRRRRVDDDVRILSERGADRGADRGGPGESPARDRAVRECDGDARAAGLRRRGDARGAEPPAPITSQPPAGSSSSREAAARRRRRRCCRRRARLRRARRCSRAPGRRAAGTVEPTLGGGPLERIRSRCRRPRSAREPGGWRELLRPGSDGGVRGTDSERPERGGVHERAKATGRRDRPGGRAVRLARLTGAAGGDPGDDRVRPRFQLPVRGAVGLEIAPNGSCTSAPDARSRRRTPREVCACSPAPSASARARDAAAAWRGSGRRRARGPGVSSCARCCDRSSPCSRPTSSEPSEAGAPSQAPIPARADLDVLVTPRSPAPVRSSRLGHRAAAGVAGADEQRRCIDRSPSWRESPDRAPQLGPRKRPSRIMRGTGSRAVHQRGRRHVAQHAAVEHQQRAARRSRPRRSSTMAAAPGAVGPPGRLADVEVSGRSRAATSRAMPAWDVWRTAMPPSGPRSASGSFPSPPRSTRVSGPGQKASESARAGALNTSPHRSAITRPETSSRNGFRGAGPSAPRGPRAPRFEARIRGRTPSRWGTRAAGGGKVLAHYRDGGGDVARSAERQHHRSAPRRAQASASARSSAVVILKLVAESRHDRDGAAAPFHQGGVVRCACGRSVPTAPRRHAPPSRTARGNPCGVCARQSRFPRDGPLNGPAVRGGFLERVADRHRGDGCLPGRARAR